MWALHKAIVKTPGPPTGPFEIVYKWGSMSVMLCELLRFSVFFVPSVGVDRPHLPLVQEVPEGKFQKKTLRNDQELHTALNKPSVQRVGGARGCFEPSTKVLSTVGMNASKSWLCPDIPHRESTKPAGKLCLERREGGENKKTVACIVACGGALTSGQIGVLEVVFLSAKHRDVKRMMANLLVLLSEDSPQTVVVVRLNPGCRLAISKCKASCHQDSSPNNIPCPQENIKVFSPSSNCDYIRPSHYLVPDSLLLLLSTTACGTDPLGGVKNW